MSNSRTYTQAQARALLSILRAAAAHVRAEATAADSKSRALRHEDSTDADVRTSDLEFVRSLRLAAELSVLDSACGLLADARDNDTNTVSATDSYGLAVALAYNMALHLELVPSETISACRGAI